MTKVIMRYKICLHAILEMREDYLRKVILRNMAHPTGRVQITIEKVYFMATGKESSSLVCLTQSSSTISGQAKSNPPEHRRGTGEPQPVTRHTSIQKGWGHQCELGKHNVCVRGSTALTGQWHQESLGRQPWDLG